jgi:hypothetical protein
MYIMVAKSTLKFASQGSKYHQRTGNPPDPSQTALRLSLSIFRIFSVIRLHKRSGFVATRLGLAERSIMRELKTQAMEVEMVSMLLP